MRISNKTLHLAKDHLLYPRIPIIRASFETHLLLIIPVTSEYNFPFAHFHGGFRESAANWE
jgi:hypothetical protein